MPPMPRPFKRRSPTDGVIRDAHDVLIPIRDNSERPGVQFASADSVAVPILAGIGEIGPPGRVSPEHGRVGAGRPLPCGDSGERAQTDGLGLVVSLCVVVGVRPTPVDADVRWRWCRRQVDSRLSARVSGAAYLVVTVVSGNVVVLPGHGLVFFPMSCFLLLSLVSPSWCRRMSYLGTKDPKVEKGYVQVFRA